MQIEYLAGLVSTMWLTLAILAGGFARTRNRSAWAWFLLVFFLGPFGAFLLVVWPPVEKTPGS
ncbi:hypothetical protein [Microbacterium sp. 13-71-7]|uniref:hypothetical protein n=1 Tax=Microbacterium sp. 13-71-7 TaxID=1970399 RepID=UPI000BDC497F|nr:hypothetical protein [Microbacterium sp. 13-71-7]OZB81766.1 MAG: hypothetical protein B7X32_15755 [Microbacterium sp. 13-71-7]